jgi:hypothetical protein
MQTTTLHRETPATIWPHTLTTPAFEASWDRPTLESRLDGPNHRGTVQVVLGRVPSQRPVGGDPAVVTSFPAVEVGPRGAGLPVLRARVTLDGDGSGAPLGWIQLVNARDVEGNPLLEESTPITFPDWDGTVDANRRPGPEFLDAPDGPTDRAVVWEADLFLCTVEAPPTANPRGSSPVEPLVGVRWGFRVATDGGDPSPLIPRWTGDWAWASWVPVLRKRFPSRQFAERTPSVRWRDRRGG